MWTKAKGDTPHLWTRGLQLVWVCLPSWHDSHWNDLTLERLGTSRHNFFRFGCQRCWCARARDADETQATRDISKYNPPNSCPAPIICLVHQSYTRTELLTNRTEKSKVWVTFLINIKLKGQPGTNKTKFYGSWGRGCVFKCLEL